MTVRPGEEATAIGDAGRARFGLLLAAEVALITVVFCVDRPGFHLIFLSKTLYLAAIAAASLSLRRRWASIGFRLGPRWVFWLLVAIAGGAAMEALELFVTQPMLDRIFDLQPDLSDFAVIRGNVTILAISLALTWSLAAFGEEFVYRGYLLNRLRDLLAPARNPRLAGIAALVLSSAIFGLAHLYQGWAGIIENMIDGAILGALYLASGRRLLVPIIAHGIQDTTDVLLIFAALYPGM